MQADVSNLLTFPKETNEPEPPTLDSKSDAGRPLLSRASLMPYYARVTFHTDASIAERHDDEGAARRWIESERDASPESFRLGQLLTTTPSEQEIVATFDLNGWR